MFLNQPDRSYSVPIAFLLSFICLIASFSRCEAKGLDLITPKEAALPDSEEEHFEAALEEGGPGIEMISPEYGKTYTAPLPIKVRFIPKEGKGVDLSSLKVEYLKLWPINITDRLLPYATKEGIKVENVNIPPGTHKIRLSISDINGIKTSIQFIVTIKW